jgi:site-specific DNA-methyltransferase (adenine-specific)
MNVHFSSKTNEWYTPKEVFEPLHKEFNFTLDPCCTKYSAKCKKFYTEDDDGLSKDWSEDTVFVNPPYGRQIKDWVKKSYTESKKGATVVMLIPARTDTSYWHDYIFNKASDIRFIRGRIKFERQDGTLGDSCPFPVAIIVFKPIVV